MSKVNEHLSDFEKLQVALSDVFKVFGGGTDSILEAFGLSDLPVAQRYGIVFGILVFTGTVVAVGTLLVMGGSFRRMSEQDETGKPSIEFDFHRRVDRPLLLERLLDARERMMKRNYGGYEKDADAGQVTSKGLTKLATMLLGVPPPTELQQKLADVAHEPTGNASGQAHLPDRTMGFKENFVVAYRKCQDKPGGPMIPGRPEARFEAYARGYASCGDDVSLSYRRSYARIYELVCCETEKTDDQFQEVYTTYPETIVGKHCRLEALNANDHLQTLHQATCGAMHHYKKPYDPSEVWGFQPQGPFPSALALSKSFVFQLANNQAAFTILQNVTGRQLGVVMLSKDDPKNLSIQLDPPILAPSIMGRVEQLEACFLLMDRLFANGYRRIQISVDDKDSKGRKLADQLGFTFEGTILKELIMKESSRDSAVYGMLNSDWSKGARLALYCKIYGKSLAKADQAYNKKQEEEDEQNRVLMENEITGRQESKDKKA